MKLVKWLKRLFKKKKVKEVKFYGMELPEFPHWKFIHSDGSITKMLASIPEVEPDEKDKQMLCLSIADESGPWPPGTMTLEEFDKMLKERRRNK